MSVRSSILIAVILAGGFLVRLPRLGEPLLGFHATRQYTSATIARGLYLDRMTHLTPAQTAAARQAAARCPVMEPRIMEHATAWAYRVAGREDLRLARLTSVAAWAAGGIALLWLASQLFTGAGVLVTLTVMMFLPFGITASRSFQPDALMTALTVLTIALAVHHDRRRNRGALLLLTLAGCAAIGVKPMAIFLVVPPVFVLAVARTGWVAGVIFTVVWTIAISAIPIMYYQSTSVGSSFGPFPQLYRDARFWRGWAAMLHRVTTLPLAAAGLIGTVAALGTTRWILLSLWGGYFLLGLGFAHHISTHDYYSLPMIPIVALSTGALVEWMRRVTQNRGIGARFPAAIAAACLIGAGVSIRAADLFRSSTEISAAVGRYERIGKAVGHSTRVVSLDGDYAFPLNYHGFLAATNLPLSIDLALLRLTGQKAAPPEEQLAASNAEFFVATNRAELNAQPQLRAFLDERFPIVDRDGAANRWTFVVYDLRRFKISVRPDRLSVIAAAGGRSSQQTVALWSAEGTGWRAHVPAPELFSVEPAQGSGPATLRIVPRTIPQDTDRTVDVSIYSDSGAMPQATFTVRVRSIASRGDGAPFGSVDVPPDPIVLGEHPVTFQGWALDDLDFRRLWVGYTDSSGRVVSLGDAKRGGARPDVAAVYPNAHDIYNSAWAFTLQPGALAGIPRPVILRFYAEDGDGRQAEIGRRTVNGR